MVNKSIILPAFFNKSMEDKGIFIEAVKLVKKNNIDTIEFYYHGRNKEVVKTILNKHNLKSIYLGAMAAKTNNLNISSLNEKERKKSVEEIKKCILDAYYYGSQAVLINSGPRPEEKGQINSAYRSLKK